MSSGLPIASLFGGQMPPGAQVAPSPAPGNAPPQMPPMPGNPPQNMQDMSPEQLQMEMQLIQLLMQNPQFAQAVTALRARRMAGGAPGGPLPQGPAPQGGAPSPGGFADFVNRGR